MSVEPSTTGKKQWYVNYPKLFQEEIDAMKSVCSKASYGFMGTGQMYWRVPCLPIIKGERKEWTLLLLYDSDHQDRGRLIRCYPIKPDYDEISRIVLRSGVTPKIVPHCIRDANGMFYLSTECVDDIVITRFAVSALKRAFQWITSFALGILDQTIWYKWLGK